MPPKFLFRQVTTPKPQIQWQIAQNVDQLQTFAKPHGLLQHCLVVELGLWEDIGATYLGPELSHTSCHAISVIVQFLIGSQCDDLILGRASKSFQVKLLTANNRSKNLAHQAQTAFVKTVQHSQADFTFLQEDALGS